MAVEFEQSMSTIGRRSVTVTSWWDEAAGTWRASAPAYVHLLSTEERAVPACSTRGDAIRQLMRSLSDNMAAGRR